MHHLDLRGLINPFTLLKASNAFKKLKAGETMEIIGSSPEITTDLLKVLPAASCEIISSKATEGEQAGFRILLKKKTAHSNGCTHCSKSITIINHKHSNH
jgi:TusA-related sulfurtransferase